MNILFDTDWSDYVNKFAFNSAKDFSFPMHFQRSYEIIYVLTGTLLVTIDETIYEINPGDIVFIFPQQFHMLKCPEHYTGYILLFTPEFVEGFSSEYRNMVPISNILHNHFIDKNLLQPTNQYHAKATAYSLLGTLTEHTEFKPYKATNNLEILHLMISYIDLHYNENCSLQKVAKELGYSYSYLSRTFKEIMKRNYTEYLNNYRIIIATQMIKNRNMPIAEVYYECGFDNARSFNRNFKKYTGYTPTEFLKQLTLSR